MHCELGAAHDDLYLLPFIHSYHCDLRGILVMLQLTPATGASFFLFSMLLWTLVIPFRHRLSFLGGLCSIAYSLALVSLQSAVMIPIILMLCLLDYFVVVKRWFRKSNRWAVYVAPVLGVALVGNFLSWFLEVPVSFDAFSTERNRVVALGLSYITFRMVSLHVDEFEVDQPANIWEYLAYLLFFPTCFVGPIMRYSSFAQSVKYPKRRIDLNLDNIQRVVFGLLKFSLFSGMLDRISYRGIIFDGNTHGLIALPIAAVGYYLYLYVNFSGACDIVIGASRVFGIVIDENFDEPFRSKSLSEFWRRWHITLADLFRRLIHMPIALAIARHASVRAASAGSAVALFFTFVLIGLWHGISLRWLLFGSLQGLGLLISIYWRKVYFRLCKRVEFSATWHSSVYPAFSWALTHCFMASSLFLFSNEVSAVGKLGSIFLVRL